MTPRAVRDPNLPSGIRGRREVMEIEDCIGMIAMQKVCVTEAEELLAQGKGNREQLEQVVQVVKREILPSTELYNNIAVPRGTAHWDARSLRPRALCSW